MLREYDNTKEEIKSLKTSTVYQRFYYNCKTILSYCLKCRKNMEIKNPRVAKIKRGKSMLKKSRFIKEQEAMDYYYHLIHLLKDFLWLVVFYKGIKWIKK